MRVGEEAATAPTARAGIDRDLLAAVHKGVAEAYRTENARISADPLADKTDIPATQEYGVPDGHHLFCTLGGGPNPGFFAAKRVSQALCWMPVNQNGVKVFRELPALGVLP